VVRAAGEKHQAAALTPVGSVKMTESLKEDQGDEMIINGVLPERPV
jgi:hypothetical protein